MNSFKRPANILDITLYTVVQQEIGRNTERVSAPKDFGTRVRVVAFACLSRREFKKKSKTADIKSLPTKAQEVVKNSTENPSGPGALFFGILNTVDVISAIVGIARREAASDGLHLNGCNS